MTEKSGPSPKSGVSGGRIAGRLLADMRAILRIDTGRGFSFADARKIVVRDDRHDMLAKILTDLVAEGYLVQKDADLWQCTSKGRDLQGLSRSRLSREKAVALLSEVVSRARQVNSSDTTRSV